MAKVKVFLSFEFDRDKKLHGAFMEQTSNQIRMPVSIS